MPWLSRQNSPEGIKTTDALFKTVKPVSGTAVVTLIPSQIDGLAGTSAQMYRQSSLQLARKELKVMLQNVRCLPKMATSASVAELKKEYLRSYGTTKEMALQACLMGVETWFLLVMVPLFLCAPGAVFVVAACVVAGLVGMLARGLNGRRVVKSGKGDSSMVDEFADERWLFVNGIMTR